GVSYAISCGNNACTDTGEYIDYLVDDEHTRVVCAYIESVGDPERFAAAAVRAAAEGKPIIAVKVGRSRAGEAAVVAHTGALAGSDAYVEALLRETGVLRAGSLDEALDRAYSVRNPASASLAERTPRGGGGHRRRGGWDVGGPRGPA